MIKVHAQRDIPFEISIYMSDLPCIVSPNCWCMYLLHNLCAYSIFPPIDIYSIYTRILENEMGPLLFLKYDCFTIYGSLVSRRWSFIIWSCCRGNLLISMSSLVEMCQNKKKEKISFLYLWYWKLVFSVWDSRDYRQSFLGFLPFACNMLLFF